MAGLQFQAFLHNDINDTCLSKDWAIRAHSYSDEEVLLPLHCSELNAMLEHGVIGCVVVCRAHGSEHILRIATVCAFGQRPLQ